MVAFCQLQARVAANIKQLSRIALAPGELKAREETGRHRLMGAEAWCHAPATRKFFSPIPMVLAWS
jgi:hypothetical protein